jgi:hypothetical protein
MKTLGTHFWMKKCIELICAEEIHKTYIFVWKSLKDERVSEAQK